jgi:acyl-coenzyme A synthetase/AMP-(fatty) acid ligase/acyl carrier protein
MVEHRQVVNFVRGIQRSYALVPEDRVLQFAPISFDVSVEEIFGALSSGATLVLRDEECLAGSDAFWRFCAKHAITVLSAPTAFWQQLASDAMSQPPPTLRLIVIGGEQVSAAPVRQWLGRYGDRPRLINAYGPTETTVNATQLDIHAVGAGPISIGRPTANTRVYVLDASRLPVPIGVPGELYVGGAGVARGYLNRPELTAEKFVMHDGQRLYRTGDRVRWVPDGTVEFLGRIDRQVKIRGYRVELGEIECALGTHPRVREAVVVAAEVATGSALVAYVVPDLAASPTHADLDAERQQLFAELRRYLGSLLPEYMVPAAFVSLSRLPLTVHGKVDRSALPPPESMRQSNGAYVAPTTATEQRVAAIWRAVLKLDQVGVHDNFFEIGGHSLLATRIAAQLRQEFAIDLPLRELFALQSIAEVSAYIDAELELDRGLGVAAAPLPERAEVWEI